MTGSRVRAALNLNRFILICPAAGNRIQTGAFGSARLAQFLSVLSISGPKGEQKLKTGAGLRHKKGKRPKVNIFQYTGTMDGIPVAATKPRPKSRVWNLVLNVNISCKSNGTYTDMSELMIKSILYKC